eukprot:SAG31_NODE_17182_length_680_cov_0.979346_1_plen_59_part_10
MARTGFLKCSVPYTVDKSITARGVDSALNEAAIHVRVRAIVVRVVVTLARDRYSSIVYS